MLDFAKISDSQKDSHSWKKSTFVNSSEKLKNERTLKTINKSTLSLHIAAYENSVGTTNFVDEKKECFKQETVKQPFTDSLVSVIQKPFEFPRQQETEEAKMPEVAQFKASQRLLKNDDKPLPQKSSEI
uniref:Uncharacterized protein n=1 Tax=Panagrolaimus sp. PS1159 TaxID=55785 RepID=A0AC35FBG4_9BILA